MLVHLVYSCLHFVHLASLDPVLRYVSIVSKGGALKEFGFRASQLSVVKIVPMVGRIAFACVVKTRVEYVRGRTGLSYFALVRVYEVNMWVYGEWSQWSGKTYLSSRYLPVSLGIPHCTRVSSLQLVDHKAYGMILL